MNDEVNQQILIEIRKLRRHNQVASVACLFLLIAAIIYFLLRLGSLSSSHQAQQSDSWAAVRAAEDYFEYDKALAMAKRIAARFPKDHYGYAELAHISLITGDVRAAQSYYQRAYELFPSETYEQYLAAIRKRVQNESMAQPTASP